MSSWEDSDFSLASAECLVDARGDPFGWKKARGVLILMLLPFLEVFPGVADTMENEEKEAPTTKYPNANGLSFMKEEIECVGGLNRCTKYSACTYTTGHFQCC